MHMLCLWPSEDRIFLAKAGALSLNLGWNSYYIGTARTYRSFFDIDFKDTLLKVWGAKKVNDSVSFLLRRVHYALLPCC